MKTRIIAAIALLLLAWPMTRADNVTAHGTIGMLEAQLVTRNLDDVGRVNLWNTTRDISLMVTPAEGYLLSKVYVFINPEPPPPPREDGQAEEPDFGAWPYVTFYKKDPSADPYYLTLNFEDDLDFQWGHWGPRWLEHRLLTVGVRVELKSTDAVPVTLTAWALNPHQPIGVQRCGWGDNALAMRYEVLHPKRGKFIAPAVVGLGYETWTQQGLTGSDGGFWFYPGEYVTFNIGSVELGQTQADDRITPLDLFAGADLAHPSVANMTRLLQSMDTDEDSGRIDLTLSSGLLGRAMGNLGVSSIDFSDTEAIGSMIDEVVSLGRAANLSMAGVSPADAIARLERSAGDLVARRNVSVSPDYAVDKPKLDIMPMWVPARKSNGSATTVVYRGADGTVLTERNRVKPLFVTYTEEQDPHPEWGRRREADIITAVSLDDGATWKRHNVSQMAGMSSFTLAETGEKFPGDCASPIQKIAENRVLIVWVSAYARGGNPSFAIRTDDGYTADDPYAVTDYWGVRGRQGSVNYDEDEYVGDQGIGEIPYYALWACRGIVVGTADHSKGKFLDREVGELVWFRPERLTSARRDAFFPVVGSAKSGGFAIAWQEDPGGLRPGNCAGGGDGWSGATVNKKTDIWYSFIRWADFDKIDTAFTASGHSRDEHGEDEHGQQPGLSNRPKWLVPMSLPVRVSDNNTVNTDNLKVVLDASTGLPEIDPATGGFIPLAGAEEEDYVAREHESEGSCDDGEGDDGHEGHSGTGGGWGMTRYAYLLPELGIADLSGTATVWDGTTAGEFRPGQPTDRYFRFINKPGMLKTVLVTADGRVLDGDTGACRPNLFLVPDGKGSAWAILGYEETKGLGTPPQGGHEAEALDRPEPDDSGKNVIYHTFRFDQPDRISAGEVVNLPALDDHLNLIPIYYKDATGASTGIFRQYKTENARRIRFLVQPRNDMLKTPGAATVMMVLYKQGREGQGRPSDIFAIRCVVPPAELNTASLLNPYRIENFERLDTAVANPDANGRNRYLRKAMNMTSSTVEAIDPLDIAMDDRGQAWAKVARWSQSRENLSDESFANGYSEAKGHRGFIRGKTVVIGYSLTPNWACVGEDPMNFYVRRSFDGGRSWTTDPQAQDTVHTIIEKDLGTGVYRERQQHYGPGEFEPGRNVSLLKGDSHTVVDPRLVPPMGPGTVNPTYPEDDTVDPDVFYVAFGTATMQHDLHTPLGDDEVGGEAEDIHYTRTTDGGTTWLQVPWVINPDNADLNTGETVFTWPWLAHGTSHQGHAQIRMHPSGTRFYAIWHQWAHGDEAYLAPDDLGDDIWFRRIDFMDEPE